MGSAANQTAVTSGQTTPIGASDVSSALTGGGNSETALFKYLSSQFPGSQAEIALGPQTSFQSNTVGGVLARLFGASPDQAMPQASSSIHDEAGAGYRGFLQNRPAGETPAEYYARLSQQARQAAPAASSPIPAPAAAKPVKPTFTKNTIVTQSAMPKTLTNTVTTGANGGFQAADTFKAPAPTATA